MSELLKITFNDSVFYSKTEFRKTINSDSDCDCRDWPSDCPCIRDNRC